jgi:transketolase
MNIPRALHGTRVARCAKPDGGATQHFIAKTLAHHGDHATGRVDHVVTQRTCCTACAALDAAQQFLTVGFGRDIFTESAPYLDLLKKYGLSADHIARAVEEVLKRKKG